MIAGKIHAEAREYVVDCTGCGEQFVNHLYTQYQFIQSLLYFKWEKNWWIVAL
jgi:hypothetical protein